MNIENNIREIHLDLTKMFDITKKSYYSYKKLRSINPERTRNLAYLTQLLTFLKLAAEELKQLHDKMELISVTNPAFDYYYERKMAQTRDLDYYANSILVGVKYFRPLLYQEINREQNNHQNHLHILMNLISLISSRIFMFTKNVHFFPCSEQ